MPEPTVEDWVERARVAANADAAHDALDAGARVATTSHAWRALLAASVELRELPTELVRAYAARTLEEGARARDVWAFRDAAVALAERCGDRDAAYEALGRCAACFEAAATTVRGYEWALLAEGFAEIVGGGAGVACARRALDAGLANARSGDDADDLTTLATALERAPFDGARDEARAVLAEAEALAERTGSATAWALANAWFAMGDTEAATRVLARSLGRAKNTLEAIHVARAWASHGRRDESERAFERGEELATSTAEWLALADTAHDAGLGLDVVRRAVTAAERVAENEADRARVASAYALRLTDRAAANRVGPRGVRPDDLRPRLRRLLEGASSASGLFDWLRERLDERRLEAIAGADYGMDAPKHLAALRDIVTTGLVPRQLTWEPHEVLALVRWGEGERVDHVARAFSALLLCIAPDELDEFVTNGVIVLDSALELESDALAHAESFFLWYAESSPEEEPFPVDAALALVLVAIARAARSNDERGVTAAARALATIEGGQTLREVGAVIGDSMRARFWDRLLEEHLGPLRAEATIDALLASIGRPLRSG